MAKPKLTAARKPTAWEANCLFCGTQLHDEGEGFLAHMGATPDCHDAYDAWVANLDLDRPGG